MAVDILVDDGPIGAACEQLDAHVPEIDLGPGWFESSHELKLGLCVFEVYDLATLEQFESESDPVRSVAPSSVDPVPA